MKRHWKNTAASPIFKAYVNSFHQEGFSAQASDTFLAVRVQTESEDSSRSGNVHCLPTTPQTGQRYVRPFRHQSDEDT